MNTEDIIRLTDLTDRQSIEALLFAVRNGGISPQVAAGLLCAHGRPTQEVRATMAECQQAGLWTESNVWHARWRIPGNRDEHESLIPPTALTIEEATRVMRLSQPTCIIIGIWKGLE